MCVTMGEVVSVMRDKTKNFSHVTVSVEALRLSDCLLLLLFFTALVRDMKKLTHLHLPPSLLHKIKCPSGTSGFSSGGSDDPSSPLLVHEHDKHRQDTEERQEVCS